MGKTITVDTRTGTVVIVFLTILSGIGSFVARNIVKVYLERRSSDSDYRHRASLASDCIHIPSTSRVR